MNNPDRTQKATRMIDYRWQSLKARYAIIASIFIAVILILNAVLLVYIKSKEFRNEIEQRAYSFAKLAVKPICDGYDTYYYSGYFKFRELINNLMPLDPDVMKILLLDVNGRLLFSSDELLKNDFVPQVSVGPPIIRDHYQLEAIRKVDISRRHITDKNGQSNLEIVSPYVEEWGRHKYSVIMYFSYHTLYPQIRMRIYQVAALTLLSMLIASFLAWVVAGRITKPLEKLTEQAKGLITGSFEETEPEGSKSEIEVLTNTFHLMTSKIQENIRQLEDNNLKLANLNEELKELDRLKSDLLANVSHELRTPLTSIKGYTEYILEGKLGGISQKQEKGLMVVLRNLERLSKLINALVDYSLIEASRMILSVQPFDLKLLCRQIIVSLRSELMKRGLLFEILVPEDLPLVVGDRDKLYQVIENLVVNALKFTDSGGQIIIGAEPHKDNRSWVKIFIRDTGIGIPEAAIPRIFDRFYQVDATSKRKYGGIGLGLAIAKSIVYAHGGTIEVESTVGIGTTFIILLPGLQESRADDQELSQGLKDNAQSEIFRSGLTRES